MVDKALHDALIQKLDAMPLAMQRRVLEYASSIQNGLPPGTPGRDLLRFAGTISPEDCKAMEQAIEEGCEKVDLSGW
jgi:hypothetical protein